ncbi:Uncharacterised protein [Yersinia intermedia]|nr:Uncharacterised protein [Yersinia intermedia]CNG99964.1 Uncharacterised protein [Yersinia intermedia]
MHDVLAVAHRRHTLEQLVFEVSVQGDGHDAPAGVAIEVQVHLRHVQAERVRQHAEGPEVPGHGEIDPGTEPRPRPGQRLYLRPPVPIVEELELEGRDRELVHGSRVLRVVEVLYDPQDRRRRLEREVQVHKVAVVDVGCGDFGQRVQRLRGSVPDPHVAVSLDGDQRRLAYRARHGLQLVHRMAVTGDVNALALLVVPPVMKRTLNAPILDPPVGQVRAEVCAVAVHHHGPPCRSAPRHARTAEERQLRRLILKVVRAHRHVPARGHACCYVVRPRGMRLDARLIPLNVVHRFCVLDSRLLLLLRQADAGRDVRLKQREHRVVVEVLFHLCWRAGLCPVHQLHRRQ